MSRDTFDLDRRRFLGSAALATGGVALASLLPEAANSAETAPAAVVPSPEDELWNVDVICGHWPPYAHPIPYGRPDPEPVNLAHVDPIDHLFVA